MLFLRFMVRGLCEAAAGEKSYREEVMCLYEPEAVLKGALETRLDWEAS